jgi:Mg-chelatase subunit ChlD
MLGKIAPRVFAAILLTIVVCNPSLAQDEKLSYGILIDNTGSLRTQLSDVLDIAKGFVDANYQRASISLFNFKSEGDRRNPVAVVTSGTGWTQDHGLLVDYLENLYIIPGQTTLKDAINAIAQELNARGEADKDVHKRIVLISDGEDRVSKIKEKPLIKLLVESGIKVYAIGLTRELKDDGDAKSFLKKITTETGGRVIFPKWPIVADKLVRELLAK